MFVNSACRYGLAVVEPLESQEGLTYGNWWWTKLCMAICNVRWLHEHLLGLNRWPGPGGFVSKEWPQGWSRFSWRQCYTYRTALYFRGAKFSRIGLAHNFADRSWIAVSHAHLFVPSARSGVNFVYEPLFVCSAACWAGSSCLTCPFADVIDVDGICFANGPRGSGSIVSAFVVK